MTSLHRFSGPDGFSDPETLPPVTDAPMGREEALRRLVWLYLRESETHRLQSDRNAMAIKFAFDTLQNQIEVRR